MWAASHVVMVALKISEASRIIRLQFPTNTPALDVMRFKGYWGSAILCGIPRRLAAPGYLIILA